MLTVDMRKVVEKPNKMRFDLDREYEGPETSFFPKDQPSRMLFHPSGWELHMLISLNKGLQYIIILIME